jgi:uncharacterized protein YndB with AHSA1/START domain
MYHRPNDVKATLPRSEALKSKKAKADPRPSGVMMKSKKAEPSAPAPAHQSLSRAEVKPGGRAKPASSAVPTVVVGKASARAVPPPPQEAVAKSSNAKVARLSANSAKSPKAAAAGKPGGSAKPAPAAASKLAEPTPPPPAAEPKKVARKSIKEAAGVSTDAVARRTGKTWDDWFEVLDSAGAATLDQRGIVAILAQKHGIGPWWQQMIAVGYESLRGKSERPPAADGFQLVEKCTLNAPVARVFKLWNDASDRARWLADDRFVVKSATPGKVLRARWGKGNSQVTVSFSEKAGKTEVAVEHQHIESRAAADQMKAYWQKKLALLDEALAERR